VSNYEKVIRHLRDTEISLQTTALTSDRYEGLLPKMHGRGEKLILATFIEKPPRSTRQNLIIPRLLLILSIRDHNFIFALFHGRFRQKAKNHLRPGAPMRRFRRLNDLGGKHRESTRCPRRSLRFTGPHEYLRCNDNSKSFARTTVRHQRASHFISKSGCPICRQSRGEFRVEQVLKRFRLVLSKQKAISRCRKR